MSANISVWDSSTPSKPLHELWQVTVASVYKPYALPSDKFHSLITAPLARVYIASDPAGSIIGFALTYLIRSGSQWTPALAYQKGSLAALVVHPSHQGRGVGSALHAQALGHLTGKVRTSLEESDPPAEKSQIQLGSIFPRIFPGIPDGPEFDDAKRWFERRGWEFGPKKSIDLYQRLTPGRREDLEGLMRKATGRGFTFGAPGEKDIEALYQLQKDNFESYTGWPDMFPRLVEAGRLRDIHVAWDKDGRVVGATVAALQEHGEGTCPMHEVLAWPATLGSACGVIACVGVAASTRGSGAGVAMVASATQYLIDRGADGCFIDWVDMDGFYEKCGYDKWEKAYLGAWRTVERR